MTDIIYKEKMLMTDMEMQRLATASAYCGGLSRTFDVIISNRNIIYDLEKNTSKQAEKVRLECAGNIEYQVVVLKNCIPLVLEYVKKLSEEMGGKKDADSK
jgi:hypothetical protein